MSKLKYVIRMILLPIVKWTLPKHPFKRADLVKVPNTKGLYEVEELLYTESLDWYMIMRVYGDTKLVSVTKNSDLPLVEYKHIPDEDFG